MTPALVSVAAALLCACASQEPVRTQAVGAVLDAGRDWLVAHQSPDGAWDGDGFTAQCPAGSLQCNGLGGFTEIDTGATALAVLALLGAQDAEQRAAAERGLAWLVAQQDPETGLIGKRLGHAFMYGHGIAALALCEAQRRGATKLREPAQKAVAFIVRGQNPYAAWRYECPPTGENDTSVSGWMVCALESARRGGLTVDPQAFAGAVRWFDEVTEVESGRVGYDSVGSSSSRITGVNDEYPTQAGEAMTAEALHCRLLLGQEPKQELLAKQLALLQRKLPEWDATGRQNDVYYWYHGTAALVHLGDERWTGPWLAAMHHAASASQASAGHARGSWDPKDPWGEIGGRVFSTALMCLCLAA